MPIKKDSCAVGRVSFKQLVVRHDMRKGGKIDLFIYSLASPRRTDPVSGDTFKSTLKPVGEEFHCKTANTDKDLVEEVVLQPASEDEVEATKKVMGGEDWALWVKALEDEGLFADNASTMAYSYIGPDVTWPIYKDGTIGQAKAHLEQTARELDKQFKERGGRALVSVNKAVVTQASSAIPVVPLYNSLLFKIMRAKGNHEGCIEQCHRLFVDKFIPGQEAKVDEQDRIRLDDWELSDDIQAEVREIWPGINTDTVWDLTDYKAYKEEFLSMFGFGFEGIDYDAEVEIELPLDGWVVASRKSEVYRFAKR